MKVKVERIPVKLIPMAAHGLAEKAWFVRYPEFYNHEPIFLEYYGAQGYRVMMRLYEETDIPDLFSALRIGLEVLRGE